MSFGSGTGVPPVNGHGQDGRATANDTAPDARNGRTMSGFAAFVLLATRHSSLLFAAFVLLDTGHSSLATAFENSDYLSDHQSTATYKFVGVTLSIGKQAKSIDVVIVEKRGSTELVSDHFQCKGCNFCAGLISPRLNKIFEAHDLVVPDEIIQGHIDYVWIHGQWKNFRLRVPKDRQMYSVFRGSLYRGFVSAARISSRAHER